MSKEMDDYIDSFAPELQAIIRALREMAKKSMPDAYEMIYHGAIGYSLSTSPFYLFCYIAPQKSYVNLGFYYGAYLDDPQHVLVGEGKRMRHVKVRSREDASNPAFEDLLKEAWRVAPDSIAQARKKPGKST